MHFNQLMIDWIIIINDMLFIKVTCVDVKMISGTSYMWQGT